MQKVKPIRKPTSPPQKRPIAIKLMPRMFRYVLDHYVIAVKQRRRRRLRMSNSIDRPSPVAATLGDRDTTLRGRAQLLRQLDAELPCWTVAMKITRRLLARLPPLWPLPPC